MVSLWCRFTLTEHDVSSARQTMPRYLVHVGEVLTVQVSCLCFALMFYLGFSESFPGRTSNSSVRWERNFITDI